MIYVKLTLTSRKYPEYWGMSHSQTSSVMEFFGVLFFLILFVCLFFLLIRGTMFYLPYFVETFRIKILTYKAFCYCSMGPFLRKELFPEALLAKLAILMAWQHFLGTGFSNFSAWSWMLLSWGILIRIGNTIGNTRENRRKVLKYLLSFRFCNSHIVLIHCILWNLLHCCSCVAKKDMCKILKTVYS